MPETSSDSSELETSTLHYGTTHLQQATIWFPRPYTQSPPSCPKPEDGYWIIHIHGGAWRDPTITRDSFVPTLNHLLQDPSHLVAHTRAFASIDYRLSQHPSHPQDPSTTPEADLRLARHPDHIHDVIRALSELQARYAFGGKYILVGHSCGATMAFQIALGRTWGAVGIPPFPPAAIVCVEGLYDLRRIAHPHPAYTEFMTAAFGADEDVWGQVSPCLASMEEVRGWEGVTVLGYSGGDTLVEGRQREAMRGCLVRSGKKKDDVVMVDLEGDHDEVWRGGEVARCIAAAGRVLLLLGEGE